MKTKEWSLEGAWSENDEGWWRGSDGRGRGADGRHVGCRQRRWGSEIINRKAVGEGHTSALRLAAFLTFTIFPPWLGPTPHTHTTRLPPPLKYKSKKDWLDDPPGPHLPRPANLPPIGGMYGWRVYSPPGPAPLAKCQPGRENGTAKGVELAPSRRYQIHSFIPNN